MMSIFHYFNLFSFDKQTLTGFRFLFFVFGGVFGLFGGFFYMDLAVPQEGSHIQLTAKEKAAIEKPRIYCIAV